MMVMHLTLLCLIFNFRNGRVVCVYILIIFIEVYAGIEFYILALFGCLFECCVCNCVLVCVGMCWFV